ESGASPPIVWEGASRARVDDLSRYSGRRSGRPGAKNPVDTGMPTLRRPQCRRGRTNQGHHRPGTACSPLCCDTQSSVLETTACHSVTAVMPHILILGAGISGLSVAYRLQQLLPHADITLLEARDRPGGTMWTEQRDGFTI